MFFYFSSPNSLLIKLLLLLILFLAFDLDPGRFSVSTIGAVWVGSVLGWLQDKGLVYTSDLNVKQWLLSQGKPQISE